MGIKIFSPGSLMLFGAILVAIGAFWNFLSQGKQVERTLGFITGGNSASYFEYTSADRGQLEINLILQHLGEYPVYDIEAEVYEVDDKWEMLKADGYTFPKPPIKTYSRKVISPVHEPVLVFGWHIGNRNEDYFRYKILISTRNNYFVEKLTLRKVNNEWRQAWRLYKGKEENNPIKQYADPDFPRNRIGEFDY